MSGPGTVQNGRSKPSGMQVSYLKALQACTRALVTFGVREYAAPIVARAELHAVMSERQRAQAEARGL